MTSRVDPAGAVVAARAGYGRLLAVLASSGDVHAAEDALADAFERALVAWPDRGVPDNPEGWLLTVSRNRLKDRWKSAEVSRTTWLEGAPEPVSLDDLDLEAIGDRRLELMLVCAHPAIAPTDRTPLMLATVLGFTAAQISGAFAVPSTTMATRLTRAKRRIKANRIPFRIPDRHVLPERMGAVLEAVYGAYAIEHSATGPRPHGLVPEALQLAEILTDVAPKDPEAHGLAALVELSAARQPARIGVDGRFVPLADQDPDDWDQKLIMRAHDHLRRAHACGVLGRFQVEAAIQAVHCARTGTEDPNWARIIELYGVLQRIAPSWGSGVARVAAIAELDGPQVGLAALEELGSLPETLLSGWAVRGHLLARVGRTDEARAAYGRAITLTGDPAERSWLEGRRSAL
ncbi:MAG: RNA polymerase sigma factor [Propionibacteriales bacterium]|nr:RNA polymerase sigma factor [Propionibacteriales bacterium]